MPWRECCKTDERLRFVVRLLEGEKMAVVCREFDISRKTGAELIYENFRYSVQYFCETRAAGRCPRER
jgi:hypothetical protein